MQTPRGTFEVPTRGRVFEKYQLNFDIMKKLAFLSTLLFFSFQIFAQEAKPAVFSTKAGAINGYDPVSYFREGKAVKGNPKFSAKWNGATWYFSSQADLNSFVAAPEKYAPQYGGYCAYGVAKGAKASTEPDAFSVVDGKLYLNHDQDVKKTWMTDQKNYIQEADKNWPMFMSK